MRIPRWAVKHTMWYGALASMLAVVAVRAVVQDIGRFADGHYDQGPDNCDSCGTPPPDETTATLRLVLLIVGLAIAAGIVAWAALRRRPWPPVVMAWTALLLSIPGFYGILGTTPEDDFTLWLTDAFLYEFAGPMIGFSYAAARTSGQMSRAQLGVLTASLVLLWLGAIFFAFMAMFEFFAGISLRYVDAKEARLLLVTFASFGLATFASLYRRRPNNWAGPEPTKRNPGL